MYPKATTAELTLDDKGRALLPRDVRQWLEDRGINKLVAFGNNGPDGGLAFCRIDAFDEIRQRFGRLGPVHPEARLWALAMASTASTVSVDNAGRVQIPVALRNRFGLEKELYLFVATDWFELWDRERYDRWFSNATREWQRLAGFGAMQRIQALGGLGGIGGDNVIPLEGPGDDR